MSKFYWILVFLLNLRHYRPQLMEARANWPPLPDDEAEGGEVSEPNAFPFIVSIHKTNGKRTWHSCGGTIVNRNSILTAGHCVWDMKKDEPLPVEAFVLIVGTNDIKNVDKNLKFRVKKLFVHPDYSCVIQENDVAVMRTRTHIDFTLGASPVTLAESATYGDSEPATFFSNILCVVPGWGLVVDNKSYATTLMFQVDLVILSKNQCSEAVSQALQRNFAPDYELCTFREEQKICQGDSGGPLLCEGIQVGVLTWGHGCAHRGANVLARVDAYWDWIQNPQKREKTDDTDMNLYDIHQDRQGTSRVELKSFGPLFTSCFVVAIRNIL